MPVRRRLYEDVVQRCSEQDEQIIALTEQNKALQQANVEQYTALQQENKRLKDAAEQREEAHRRLSVSSTQREGILTTLLHNHETLQYEQGKLQRYCETLGNLLRDCLCYMQEVEIVAKKAGTVARSQQRTVLMERAEQLGIVLPEKECIEEKSQDAS